MTTIHALVFQAKTNCRSCVITKTKHIELLSDATEILVNYISLSLESLAERIRAMRFRSRRRCRLSNWRSSNDGISGRGRSTMSVGFAWVVWGLATAIGRCRHSPELSVESSSFIGSSSSVCTATASVRKTGAGSKIGIAGGSSMIAGSKGVGFVD